MTSIISVLFGIFIYCIIFILFYNNGRIKDKINSRLLMISGVQKEAVIDEDLEKPLFDRFFKPTIEYLGKFFSKIIPTKGDSKRSEELRKILRQAGITISISEYNAIRIIVIIGTSAMFFTISFIINLSLMMKIFMPIFGAFIAYVILRFRLTRMVTNRRELIERQLPDVLDMISVNVEAGLGFEQAMLHVINQFKGPLIDELNITYREMSMGRSRREALQILGIRCNVEDMKTFTSAVIQAGKLGIPLKNVLRTQAAAIRQSRRSKIQEKAMKISVKILIPMVMFIFPVIFIVLMGPAFINIVTMFGGM